MTALEKAGAPAEVIEHVRTQATAAAAGADFEVWHDNWESVTWFCDIVGTSWRYVAGMGAAARTGLDYAAVVALLRELVPKKGRRRELLEDIRVMERAAMAVWAEQR